MILAILWCAVLAEIIVVVLYVWRYKNKLIALYNATGYGPRGFKQGLVYGLASAADYSKSRRLALWLTSVPIWILIIGSFWHWKVCLPLIIAIFFLRYWFWFNRFMANELKNSGVHTHGEEEAS
jgi:hypothetical protein